MSTSTQMNGFPPPPKTQVTLANWRTPPFHKWGFQHVRELVPSADIPASGDTMELPSNPVDLSICQIDNADGRSMTFNDFLEHTHTDGIVILRGGDIVFEGYMTGMTQRTPHILMSVSKSMLGLLAGILIERGELDPEQLISEIVPEIVDTAYHGASVRHLLDMRVGIDFDEDYLAMSGPIIEYRKSTNWNPLEPGEKATDLRSFYGQLQDRSGKHGGPTNYVSPNNDLLGWVIERATGCRYAELMSTLIWQPLGATENAYITVDRLGAPRCAGGMCATTRDLARVGHMVSKGRSRNGTSIVPQGWIDDIEQGGSTVAWKDGTMAPYFPDLDISYRSQWYSLHGETPLLFGFGVHGQFLFVDRQNDIVIAKFSSQEMPLDTEKNVLTVSAATQIVRNLAN